MLQQILINTPLWVWALLAFLIYRGMLAGIGRETRIGKLFNSSSPSARCTACSTAFSSGSLLRILAIYRLGVARKYKLL